MGWTTIFMVVRILFTLLPAIWNAIREEQQKQSGREETVKAVLERFKDVKQAAKEHRDAARDRVDSGMHDDRFRRD